MSPEHERMSRRINAALWGDPCEMTCARVHRLRAYLWALAAGLDLWFAFMHGEDFGHCRRIRHRERMRRIDDLDQRFRMVEGQ